ncbi:MAG: hypothetical protein RL653_1900 [Pseudomonadota bacterium]|jgi:hypothetical protein
MRALIRGPLLAALVAAVAPVAGAQEVYTWTDASGTTHFSENPAEAPRGVKVRTLSGEEVSVLPSGPSPAKKPSPPAPQEVPDGGTVQRVRVPRVDPRAEEQRWREAFRSAHARVLQLEEAVAAGVREVEEVNGLPIRGRVQCANMGGSCMGFADPRWEQARQKLEADRAALVQARAALDELERRASSQSVPREWRR